MKVVYNNCYGGYSLSKAAYEELGLDWDDYGYSNIPRHDLRLVAMVEKLGAAADGRNANLKIANIDGNKYMIDEYDGNESVVTPDSQDWVVVN